MFTLCEFVLNSYNLNTEGLPADRMSTENATILTICERWPLMIDPQLQGALTIVIVHQ